MAHEGLQFTVVIHAVAFSESWAGLIIFSEISSSLYPFGGLLKNHWKFLKFGILCPKFFAKIVNRIARKEIIPPSGVIIKEGSKFSKGLTVLGGVVSIGFGIWDTIHGANKMKHGSKLSDEFRKVTNSLQKAQTKINEYYDIIK